MTAFENTYVCLEVKPQAKILIETWKSKASRLTDTEWMKLRLKALELIRRHQIEGMLSVGGSNEFAPLPAQEQWFAQQVTHYAPSLKRYAYTGNSSPQLPQLKVQQAYTTQSALHWLSE